MKIRNKKTGEIRDISIDGMFAVKSLAELNDEWCDYEESKEYWYVDYDGGILCDEHDNSSAEKMMISMGNCFESLEEAEKAVEKLKAWKRLKDAGFEFKGWKIIAHDSPRINFNVYRKNRDDIVPFLDLLFGSEE